MNKDVLDCEWFDSKRGRQRSSCSGGGKYFFVMPDGQIYRCVEMHSTDPLNSIGNIGDHQSLIRLMTNKTLGPCQHGGCFLQCDGFKAEQVIDGSSFVGGDVKEFAGRDYCVVQINLTAVCNWRCSYCCAEPWMRKKPSDLEIKQWSEFVSIMTNRYETGLVVLMGGEPTVHKAWEAMTSLLILRGWKVRLITNLSLHNRIIRFAKDMKNAGCYPMNNLMINVSLHPTQWKNGFDEFDDAMFMLLSLGCKVSCTIVDTPDNRRLIDELGVADRCSKLDLEWFNWIKEI